MPKNKGQQLDLKTFLAPSGDVRRFQQDKAPLTPAFKKAKDSTLTAKETFAGLVDLAVRAIKATDESFVTETQKTNFIHTCNTKMRKIGEAGSDTYNFKVAQHDWKFISRAAATTLRNPFPSTDKDKRRQSTLNILHSKMKAEAEGTPFVDIVDLLEHIHDGGLVLSAAFADA